MINKNVVSSSREDNNYRVVVANKLSADGNMGMLCRRRGVRPDGKQWTAAIFSLDREGAIWLRNHLDELFDLES